MKRVLLIGCGHMGEALLVSWLKSKKYLINIIDPNRNKDLKKRYKNKNLKILYSISNFNEANEIDFIVFAVKPIHLDNAINQVSNLKLKNSVSIISVVAGKKIKVFKNKFKKIKNFYRVMPNMPAFVGESMNCIASDSIQSSNKKNQITKLFNYSGKTIFLKNENQIDMATAVSGSGPGFVFNLIDVMEKAAVELGFKKNIAKILVLQTFKGSIDLLLKNKINAEDLVKMVATKGGTTEAGLKVMKKNKLNKIFINLIKTSYNKAKDQGK